MGKLVVASVVKTFRGLRAVDNASFEVPEHGIVALIGPNGAGKTTLFNVIAGVFPPDRGEVQWAGQRISGLRPEQVCATGVGRTFQIVRPFMGLTVLENATVGALRWARQPAEARAEAGMILERLGLSAKADAQASTLTLPERKRLEVARALATRPRLLLLDEVMAGLRPTETEQMVRVFRELHESRGLTILLIEHVMRAVMALSHDVVVLHQGRVIAHGTPEQVVRDPAVLECYLGQESWS
ncbi:MAG TPA: ABC transporter ATP-binding protein [Polyangiales bacterium]|nr:ABC transporter ATP-binding protein [Polyangiales bacterium]